MAHKVALHYIPVFFIPHSFHSSQDGFRIKRVVDVSRLLTALEADSNQHVFIANGTDLLTRYLRTFPADRMRVNTAFQQGQITVNGWHTLPDIDLLPGEALIRNLKEGAGDSSELGAEASIDVLLLTPTYYTVQLPQVLSRSGIRSLIMLTDTPGEWQRLITWCAGEYELAFVTYPQSAFAEFQLPPQKRASERTLKAWVSTLAADGTPSHVLLLDQLNINNDSMLPQINKGIEDQEDFHHEGLISAMDDVLADDPSWELLESEPGSVVELTGAGRWSSRVPLTNQILELLSTLTDLIEPFSAHAHIAGAEQANSIEALTSQLWRESLSLQSTEFLGGKCDDQTAEEGMLTVARLNQTAREIGQYALLAISKRIDTRHSNPDAIPIVVFNPSADAQARLVDTEITLPGSTHGVQIVPDDEDAAPLPCDLLPPETDDERPALRFITPEIAPYGYTTVWALPAENPPPKPQFDSQNMIENEVISVMLDQHAGTLTLYDKRTGRSFAGLNQYIDGADSGDLYRYQAPPTDSVIQYATNYPLAPQCYRSDVEQILQYLQIYRLPRGLMADGSARERLTAQFVPVSIQTTLRIPHHKPMCEVYVSIANHARDHRLQVGFPTGIQADTALFDTAFGIAERQADGSYPSGRFVTLMGSETGLTIANKGYQEVGLTSTDEGLYVAKTLLRAFGTYDHSHPNLPGAENTQIQADIEATYALIPHDADLETAWKLARSFQQTAQTIAERQHNGPLAAQSGLVKALPEGMVLTGITRGIDADSLIIRMVNLWDEPLTGNLEIGFRYDAVIYTSPLDIPLERTGPRHDKKTISFAAGPKEIVTLRFSGVRV